MFHLFSCEASVVASSVSQLGEQPWQDLHSAQKPTLERNSELSFNLSHHSGKRIKQLQLVTRQLLLNLAVHMARRLMYAVVRLQSTLQTQEGVTTYHYNEMEM